MARPPPKEGKTIVPLWMCSYSDMMTNLLCFFILCVALANNQEAGFSFSGIGSYLDTIEALGLPGMMPSHRTLIPKDSPLARYRPPRIDPLEKENWVEHTDRMLHEELDLLKSGKSDVLDKDRVIRVPLGCTFSTRSARLTLKDRENLEKLAPTLAARTGRIEVLGACAPDEGETHRERLELSLQRARAVVRYLEQARVPAERLVPIGGGAIHAVEGTEGGKATPRKVTLRWHLGEEGPSAR